MQDYATKLKDAVVGWNKVATATLKKDKDWLSYRRESYEQNMKRYKKGLGATSKLTPTNQEVDQDLESKFYHT
jgi:predicted O-linked N-acetylglucosamine transferase (SPINDLY family)